MLVASGYDIVWSASPRTQRPLEINHNGLQTHLSDLRAGDAFRHRISPFLFSGYSINQLLVSGEVGL